MFSASFYLFIYFLTHLLTGVWVAFLQFYQLIFFPDFPAEDSIQSVALSNQEREFDETLILQVSEDHWMSLFSPFHFLHKL